MLDAVTESSPGSYEFDDDLNVNKTMVSKELVVFTCFVGD